MVILQCCVAPAGAARTTDVSAGSAYYRYKVLRHWILDFAGTAFNGIGFEGCAETVLRHWLFAFAGTVFNGIGFEGCGTVWNGIGS